jgi:hypothetical protein
LPKTLLHHAKLQGKAELLFIRQLLIVEHRYVVLIHTIFDRAGFGIR